MLKIFCVDPVLIVSKKCLSLNLSLQNNGNGTIILDPFYAYVNYWSLDCGYFVFIFYLALSVILLLVNVETCWRCLRIAHVKCVI